jgi:hypothetical protein
MAAIDFITTKTPTRERAMKHLWIIIAMLLVFPASVSAKEKVVQIDMTASGSVLHVSDVRSFYDVHLKGSPGAAHARGAGESYFADLPDTPCPDIGVVDGLKMSAAQANIVFNDGSMFYGKVVEEESYVCFGAPVAHVVYDIVGGTGRFDGATGYVVFDLEMQPIEPGSLLTPETGHAYGEIILP